MSSVDPRLASPLRAVSRRLVLLAAMNGALAGVLVAIVGLVVWVLAQPVLRQGAFPGGTGTGAGPGAAVAWVGVATMLGASLALLARFRARRRHGGPMPDAARRVESEVRASRNVVLTAAEFPDTRVPLEPRVREAILLEASSLLSRHSPRSIVPLHGSGLSLAGASAVVVGLLLTVSAMEGSRGFPPGFPASLVAAPSAPDRSGTATGMDVRVRIVPPGYSGDSVRVYRNPERVEALQGSRLELVVQLQARRQGGRAGATDPGERIVLETLDGRRDLQEGGSGEHVGEMTVEVDGFLVLERGRAVSAAGDGPAAPSRVLIGLGALVDPPPTVRILAPGQDLYLPDGNRVMDLEVEAIDDRALRSLELLFTRVSGFGELFEFREGSIPLDVTRHEAGRWTARARWDLAALELDRGDVVVYRAVAHDRRPGAPPGESDTWTVEILGSEAAPSGGFAGEDELTRYGLSQQMVLVLTERLREQRPTLSAERLAEEVSMLAAAQRRVRAEFVFMLGGELEDGHDHADDTGIGGTGDGGHDDHGDHDDHGHGHAGDPASGAASGSGFDDPDARTAQELHEEAHARADADAAEGRLAQAGRIELGRAIQAMSQAVTHLNAVDLDAALVAEARALEYLQRAFSSSRYILRALSEREELDPGRRLSGERGTAVADRRPQVDPGRDEGLVELREILGQVILLASTSAPPPASGPAAGPGSRTGELPSRGAPDASALAARLLAVDPASETLQRLSASLSGSLATAAADLEGASAREGLLHVVTELSRYLRSRHAPHPGTPPTPGFTTMERAWAEALQRAGAGGW